MSTIAHQPHPAWCDPRTHVEHGPHDHEHRDSPMASEVPGTTLTAGRSQLVGTGDRRPEVGAVTVRLDLTDVATDAELAVDMTPAKARMLAAALVCRAELAEAGRGLAVAS